MIIFIIIIVLSTHQALAQVLGHVDPINIPQRDGRVCPLDNQEVERGRRVIREGLISSLLKEQCGGGIWHRIAYLNVSDPSQQCPVNWREYNTNGIRACGRQSAEAGCSSRTYQNGFQYSKVCGRITGYQVLSPDAFTAHALTARFPASLDNAYVDGVSVTYGYPRTHIWTFAAGLSEQSPGPFPQANCPCYQSNAVNAPAFIGNNFFCESGNSAPTFPSTADLLTSDPLWDGKMCEGQCCSNGKSPPWFRVTLAHPTTSDIEVRICADQVLTDEDTPIALMEIYVQ